MFTYIGKIIATGLIALASLFSPMAQNVQTTPEIGAAVNAVGGKLYYLSGSGVSSSATTMTVTSFQVAGGSFPLTMSDFGAMGCGTIEPGHTTRQEFISFTGLTQNSDGTATLSGITRGLSPVSPYTASTTQRKAHSGGSTFVLSNSPPCFYEGYANLTQDEAVTGTWNYNSHLPTSSLTPTVANQLATKAYIDGVAIAGAPIADNLTLGIVRLATALDLASSTDDFEEPLVAHSSYATSSPGTTCGLCLPMTQNNGKLSPNFTDFTVGNTYSGRNMYTASTTFTSTTTISALNVKSNALIINNIPYKMPVTQGAAGTLLTNDGTGVNTWAVNTPVRYIWANISPGFSVSNNTTSTTTDGLFIPGGTLNASSTIEVKLGSGNICASSGSGSATVFLRTSTGLPIWQGALTSDTSSVTGHGQTHEITIVSNNSATFASQLTIDNTATSVTTGGGESPTFNTVGGSAAVDFSQDQTLKLVLTNQSCDSQTASVGAFVVTASR